MACTLLRGLVVCDEAAPTFVEGIRLFFDWCDKMTRRLRMRGTSRARKVSLEEIQVPQNNECSSDCIAAGEFINPILTTDCRVREPDAGRAHVPPHVLIYAPTEGEGMALAERLRRGQIDATVNVVHSRRAIDASTEHIDVAFLEVAGISCDGLAIGAELTGRQPWVEVVFWFPEGSGCPGAAVARSLGITRIIPGSHLGDWAACAILSLARIAQARREQLAAEQSVPPVPSTADVDTTIRLPEAERRFRETYLRRLLSESSSHAVAARKAGIPYTTFCSMIRKLGIDRQRSDSGRSNHESS